MQNSKRPQEGHGRHFSSESPTLSDAKFIYDKNEIWIVNIWIIGQHAEWIPRPQVCNIPVSRHQWSSRYGLTVDISCQSRTSFWSCIGHRLSPSCSIGHNSLENHVKYLRSTWWKIVCGPRATNINSYSVQFWNGHDVAGLILQLWPMNFSLLPADW